MILVDSSVWIDFFRGDATPQVERLVASMPKERIAIGDLILTEVLQGFTSERAFKQARTALSAFEPVALVDAAVAVRAAQNFRRLRALGYTPRRTIDTIIATKCIEAGYTLLHSDRDFEPFAIHLGLKLAWLGV